MSGDSIIWRDQFSCWSGMPIPRYRALTVFDYWWRVFLHYIPINDHSSIGDRLLMKAWAIRYWPLPLKAMMTDCIQSTLIVLVLFPIDELIVIFWRRPFWHYSAIIPFLLTESKPCSILTGIIRGRVTILIVGRAYSILTIQPVVWCSVSLRKNCPILLCWLFNCDSVFWLLLASDACWEEEITRPHSRPYSLLLLYVITIILLRYWPWPIPVVYHCDILTVSMIHWVLLVETVVFTVYVCVMGFCKRDSYANDRWKTMMQ